MNVGMTKEQYFEMCEQLGTEPLEDEIPMEVEDFPDEVQQAIVVYYRLRDEWDTMNGIYLGKSYTGLGEILDIFEVEKEDRKLFLEWLSILDDARGKAIEASKPKSKDKTP
jgi:hypothetical protein